MDIFHVHFEVVISCKLLVAKLAFCHRSIGVVSQLVSDQHLLQAEGQVTNLRQWRQDKGCLKTSSTYKAPYVTSLRPQPHIPAILNKWAGLWKNNSFRAHLQDYYSAWYLSMLYIKSGTTGTGEGGSGQRKGGKDPVFKMSVHWGVPVTLWVWGFFFKPIMLSGMHKPLSVQPRMKYLLPDLQNDICGFLKKSVQIA